MIKDRLKEFGSIQLAKNPGRVVIFAILLFNILFFIVAALVISGLSLTGTEHMGFFEAAFYTITMILDAGCISFVVSDIGASGTAIAVICLIIVIIGMVSFTGSVIGYVTNYISNFIDNANAGSRRLTLKDHLVILNWNTRASEIINDLLYCPGKQKVVVLVDSRKSEIKKEIDERITDTIRRENEELKASIADKGFFERRSIFSREKLRNNLLIMIREGDVFSSKQLHDISLEKARSVVILGNELADSACKFEAKEYAELQGKGNTQTIKTLMQVSDITSADYSADDQKIIVEVSDDWTGELVDRIIAYKQVDGKCNIVPVRVNKILGQILSQFSLMPELNLAYRELFSNKGATFCVKEQKVDAEVPFITDYLKTHNRAIPLTNMSSRGKDFFFFSAKSDHDINSETDIVDTGYNVELNRNYWIEKKNVIILGHNSKSKDIMEGFCAFRNEWNYTDGREILDIVVVDDEKSLEKMNYYKDYSFVVKTVAASIYDKEIICSTIDEFVDANDEDTSVLILSDDSAASDDIDANALANLVYVQDIIAGRVAKDPDFDVESIDVIVEIIDPKHHDIVSSYSVDNVVISNRYISKMITQIGEKEAIFEFYNDILTYDDDEESFDSKEIYTKKVSTFFDKVPGECTEQELIRAVWNASVDPSVPEEKRYPTLALGYVKPGGRVTLFGGEPDAKVDLEIRDKIIVFTNH